MYTNFKLTLYSLQASKGAERREIVRWKEITLDYKKTIMRDTHFSLTSDWSKKPWAIRKQIFREKGDRRRMLNRKVAGSLRG